MNTFLGAIGAFLLVVGAQGPVLDQPVYAVMVLLGGIAVLTGLAREEF